MAERQFSKLRAGVRFSYPALFFRLGTLYREVSANTVGSRAMLQSPMNGAYYQVTAI